MAHVVPSSTAEDELAAADVAFSFALSYSGSNELLGMAIKRAGAENEASTVALGQMA